MNVNPFKLLREAIKAVPAVKYALGIAGIVAAITIIGLITGYDWRLASIGTIIVLVLMVILAVFAKLVSTGKEEFLKPIKFLTWACVIITVLAVSLILTSIFFNRPLSLEHWISGKDTKESNYDQNHKNDIDISLYSSKQQKIHDSLIIFVHGLGGSAVDTWRSDSGIGFIDLVQKDSLLSRNYDVRVYEYPTGIIKSNLPSIKQLANGLRTEIDNRYNLYDNVVLVGHSMGGLVARKYLVDEVKSEKSLKVSKLLLYAVPNIGSQYASIAKTILPKNDQTNQLEIGSEFLQDLNEDWKRLKMEEMVRVKYISGGLDKIVPSGTVHPFWAASETEIVINKDHRNLVKPSSIDDLSYQILHKFLNEEKTNDIVVDLSHGQYHWTGFKEGIQKLELFNHEFHLVESSFQKELQFIDKAPVLVLALPKESDISKQIIDYIMKWVSNGGGLLVLGYYAAEGHHVNNINDLTKHFGFEFGDDILLPDTIYTYSQVRNARFSHKSTIKIRVPDSLSIHPIFKDVNNLHIWAASSIKKRADLQFMSLATTDSIAIYKPEYHVLAGTELPNFKSFSHSLDKATILTISCYGSGRIAALATWRMVSLDEADNHKLVSNIISWLSNSNDCNKYE